MRVRERARDWLGRAEEWAKAVHARAASHLDGITSAEHKRLAVHAFAASLVAAAYLLQRVLGAAAGELWLFHAAIALTAAFGGGAATLVAVLLSMLAVRLSSAVPVSTVLLFGVEGLLIGFVVLRLARALAGVQGNLEELRGSMLELESAERRANRRDRALTRFDQASEERILILLDESGRVTDWGAGAARLYGFESAEKVGTGAAALLDVRDRLEFPGLLAAARSEPACRSCRQVRVDGSVFDAEVEVSPLSPDGIDGFSMIVYDLTRQQARAAADWSTAETQAQLRGEVELAQQQLLTLQNLTDPALNLLGSIELISELLDRLRTAIHAEGIGLIDVGRQPRHLFCASEGLQCQPAHHRPPAGVITATTRTVMIHNDPVGVAEMSEAAWPEDVVSLIAFPVVRAGSTTAVLEVVNRTGRRATEWEIALVQVVAARIAGLLEDKFYVDATRRAWAASAASSDSRFVSGSSLRLTLDDHVSGPHESAEGQPG